MYCVSLSGCFFRLTDCCRAASFLTSIPVKPIRYIAFHCMITALLYIRFVRGNARVRSENISDPPQRELPVYFVLFVRLWIRVPDQRERKLAAKELYCSICKSPVACFALQRVILAGFFCQGTSLFCL